ncbi:hypothetical protein [uncultured Ruminococcus sp.]|uniref:hypothetical protein n=1 Tax=uncultured Ruminococcus sp. TaxID=165186 RepID=UPI0025F85A1D|nr:hypothetical protein [uncultured Ruminococcus sp.]
MNEKQIVFKLSELESELDRKKWDMKLEEEKYEKNKPVQPMRQIAQKNPYPEIVSKVKYNYILGLIIPIIIFVSGLIIGPISIFPAWGLIIYSIVNKSKQKKKDIEIQRNSQEYIEKCKEIDKINVDNQSKLDAEYNQVLVKYNEEAEKYNNKWSIVRNEIEKDINKISDELTELYDSSKLIPKQYRDARILQEIYEIMDSANYSVKEAIETFDRNRQLELDAARLAAQHQANEVAMEQNDLLAESNSIAERARHEANIANIVGTIQRHNTNRTLRNINRKL